MKALEEPDHTYMGSIPAGSQKLEAPSTRKLRSSTQGMRGKEGVYSEIVEAMAEVVDPVEDVAPAPKPRDEVHWLDQLPTKPLAKVYRTSGQAKPRYSKDAHQGKFKFLMTGKGRWRLCGTQRDFRLPPTIYAPMYPLCSVNDWKTLAKNSWTRDALAIFEKPQERMPPCICTGKCDEDCLNHVTKIECDPSICPWQKEDCGNRAIQVKTNLPSWTPGKSEYPGGRLLFAKGYEAFATGPKGFGLRAVRDYEPHELILEYTGEVISNDEMFNRMTGIYADTTRYYCLTFVNGLVIDSGLRGSEARYVNHSCNPNCEMQKWYVKGTPRVALYVGDEPISAGTEFTYDYNFDIFKGATGQKCYCGESNCRGIIGKRFPKEKGKELPLKFKISFKSPDSEKAVPRVTTTTRAPKKEPSNLSHEDLAHVSQEEASARQAVAAARAKRAAQRVSLEPMTWKTALPRMRSSRKSIAAGEILPKRDPKTLRRVASYPHPNPAQDNAQIKGESRGDGDDGDAEGEGDAQVSTTKRKGRPRLTEEEKLQRAMQRQERAEYEQAQQEKYGRKSESQSTRRGSDFNPSDVKRSRSGSVEEPSRPRRSSRRLSEHVPASADQSDSERPPQQTRSRTRASMPAMGDRSNAATRATGGTRTRFSRQQYMDNHFELERRLKGDSGSGSEPSLVERTPSEPESELSATPEVDERRAVDSKGSRNGASQPAPLFDQPPQLSASSQYAHMTNAQLQQQLHLQNQMLQFMQQQQGLMMMPGAMWMHPMMGMHNSQQNAQGGTAMPPMPPMIPGMVPQMMNPMIMQQMQQQMGMQAGQFNQTPNISPPRGSQPQQQMLPQQVPAAVMGFTPQQQAQFAQLQAVQAQQAQSPQAQMPTQLAQLQQTQRPAPVIPQMVQPMPPQMQADMAPSVKRAEPVRNAPLMLDNNYVAAPRSQPAHEQMRAQIMADHMQTPRREQ